MMLSIRRRQSGDDGDNNNVPTGKEDPRKKTRIMSETQRLNLRKSVYEVKNGILSFSFYPAFLLLAMMVLSAAVLALWGHNFFTDAQADNDPIQINVGRMPLGIEYNPNNGNIYVANAESSTVSVIIGSSNTVIEPILVGRSPVWLDYVNDKVYVSNYGSDDVYVIDGSAYKVVKVIHVGQKPFGITHDSNQKFAYVSNLVSPEGPGTISMINAIDVAADTTTAEPAAVAPVTFEFEANLTGGTEHYNYTWNFGDGSTGSNEQNPEHTFDKAGNYTVTLNVTDSSGQTVSNSSLITVEAPPPLSAVEITPPNHTEGNDATAANATSTGGGNQSASEVRGQIQEASMQLNLGSNALQDNMITATARESGGDEAANDSNDDESGDEAANDSSETEDGDNGGQCEEGGSGGWANDSDVSDVVGTITLGGDGCVNHFFIAYSNNNDALYLSGFSPGVISMINPNPSFDRPHVNDIAVRGSPAGMAYNPENGYLYVGNFATNELSVINTVDNREVKTYRVGGSPIDVVYDDNTSRLYVTNFGSHSISMIDTQTDKTCDLPLEEAPFGIIYFKHSGSANDGNIYVTNPYSNSVTMIDPTVIDSQCAPQRGDNTPVIVAVIVIIIVFAAIVYFTTRIGWAKKIGKWVVSLVAEKKN